jgi:DNA phosphorothioation-dependent restriction protein DptG
MPNGTIVWRCAVVFMCVGCRKCRRIDIIVYNIESDRFKVFLALEGTKQEMQELTVTTVVLLALVGAISTVSMRYQRLHHLIETLGVEFNRSSNAAVTIFNVPITTETTVAVLQLLFVESAVLALVVLR